MRILTMLALVFVVGCNKSDAPVERAEQVDPYPVNYGMAVAQLSQSLEIVAPLTAAGILADAGWDCLPYGDRRACWTWTRPVTGAPVDHYVVEWRFTTRDTSFFYWLANPCITEEVRVAGVDSLGRQGAWSVTGVCE